MKHIHKPYITIYVKDGNIDKAIRRLGYAMVKAGVIKALKDKRHALTPSEKTRMKSKAARTRVAKELKKKNKYLTE